MVMFHNACAPFSSLNHLLVEKLMGGNLYCTHVSCHVFGQCSEVCGGGEQQRIVTCPEEHRCDGDLQPSNIQSCNSQPCAQWLTGSWEQVDDLCVFLLLQGQKSLCYTLHNIHESLNLYYLSHLSFLIFVALLGICHTVI